MTNNEIFELIKKCLPENVSYSQDGGLHNKCKIEGTLGDIFKFVQEIRKQTINEILISLKDVPNSEANRVAINRIMVRYDG